MGNPIESVTIVGGGTAGWLTAALLQAFGRKGQDGKKPLQITVIESPDIPTVGVGEATVPGIVRTLKNAGLSEREFFKRCNASFKLGVIFDNWNVDAKGKPISYLNPFTNPPAIRGIDLANYFERFGAGQRDYVQSYLPTMELIKTRKGPRALGAKEYDKTLRFAYHLDAGKFAGLLAEHCIAKGVKHVRENVLKVEQDERDNVSTLHLDKSGKHPVELIIDCTGFRGLIINQVLKEPFESYSKYLANDRAMAVQVPHPDPNKIEPVTRSTALGAGWSWCVPLFNRIGTGYVYSSAHRTDEQAREEFLQHLGPLGKDAEPRIIPMRVGRNRNAWVKNCIAIGLSGGFIEPLESTAIHMIDMGVRWLLAYFPDSNYPEPMRRRYNQLIDKLYDEVRDFIIVHYRLGNRTDSQYWIDARQELELPDRLAENLELWRYNLPSHYDLDFTSLFDANTYNAVLLGKQVYKSSYVRGEVSSGLVLDKEIWRGVQKDIQAANAKRVAKSADHHTLLSQMRGDPKPTAPTFKIARATVPLPGQPGFGQIAPATIKIETTAPKRDTDEKDDISIL